MDQNDKWVRCQSKSRPNQYYMFNCSTGETRWCTESSSNKGQQNITLSANNMKTPAQDRLKRLQNQLEKTKHKETGIKLKKQLEFANKQQNLKAKKEPLTNVTQTTSTSSSKCNVEPKNHSLTCNKSTPEKNKESTGENLPEKGKKVDISQRLVIQREDKKSPPEKNHIKTNETNKSEGVKSAVAEEPTNRNEKHKFQIPKKPPNQLENTAKKKSKKRKHDEKLSSNPISMPLAFSKEIPTANYPKKLRLSEDNSVPKIQEKMMVDNTITAKDESSADGKKSKVASVIKDFCSSIFNKLKPPDKKYDLEAANTKHSNLSSFSRTSFKSKKPALQQENQNQVRLTAFSAKSALSSPVEIGNANDRLERLRKSLQAQQSSLSHTSPILSPSDLSVPSSQDSFQTNQASFEETESMDWSPVLADTPSVNETNSSFLSPSVSSANESNFSEHFATINQNLLRLKAEKNHQMDPWRKDHFYFIVDTNVFLENITFIDELTTMKLSDTKGTVIYVPFCVLQELDKLKIRSPSESIKLRAARAIKFLNKALETRAQNVQAQSSAEENRHLIKVKSPDDSILNCCLQVSQHIDNLLLLSEDINLRNKAMSSDILVSTKSDLISKHESLL